MPTNTALFQQQTHYIFVFLRKVFCLFFANQSCIFLSIIFCEFFSFLGAGHTLRYAMEMIGSRPVVPHVQEASSFDVINRYRRELVGEICRQTKPGFYDQIKTLY